MAKVLAPDEIVVVIVRTVVVDVKVVVVVGSSCASAAPAGTSKSKARVARTRREMQRIILMVSASAVHLIAAICALMNVAVASEREC